MLLAKSLGATATKGLHARASEDLRQRATQGAKGLHATATKGYPGPLSKARRSSSTRDTVSMEPSARVRPSVSAEPSLPHTISMEPEPTSTLSEKRLGKSRMAEAGSSPQPIVPREIARKHAEQLRGSSSKQLSRV